MRRKRPERKIGEHIGQWELVEYLGGGGNAEVWVAQNEAGRHAALKVLHADFQAEDHNRYERFRHEIQMHASLSGEPGILPVIDHHLPDVPSNENPAWLATERSTLIKNALGEGSLAMVVGAVASLANTLARLHERGISHRDIKPNNLYRHGDQWVLGDFGLVSFPDKETVTVTGEKLGPALYLAPEMLNAKRADGCKADVYSLAKTLWVLATGQNTPLPGEHAVQGPHTIAAQVANDRAQHLDFLLWRATRQDPAQRMTMRGVADELAIWLQPSPVPAGPRDLSSVLERLRRASELLVAADQAERALIQAAQEPFKRLLDGIRLLWQDAGWVANWRSGDREVDTRMFQFLQRVLSGGNDVWSACVFASVTNRMVERVIELRCAAAAVLRRHGNSMYNVYLWCSFFVADGPELLTVGDCRVVSGSVGSTHLSQAADKLLAHVNSLFPQALTCYAQHLEERAQLPT